MSALKQAPTAPPVNEPRLLATWAATGAAAGLAEHLAHHGLLPLGAFAGRAGPAHLVELVTRSGLLGRGGGGYPTGRKMAAVAAARGRRVVVANGCEGDAASSKDAVLLEIAPHLVLDGIALAAHAVGATEAILCVHAGSRTARRLPHLVAQRPADPVPVEVVEIPRRYVASEETALVNALNTGDARPTVSPPRPAQRGVGGRPTLVDNIETLAHIALVARHGDAWFRRAGTRDAPGTTLVSVTGGVHRPGVVEVDCGTAVGELLGLAGGATEPLSAVLLGGLGGRWLPVPAAAREPVTPGSGVAALIALPDAACGLAQTAHILRYLAAESAGQCGPCMFGLPAVAADMEQLAAGSRRSGQAIARLHERLAVLPGRGACAHPDGAARLAASALQVFAADAARHADGAPCGVAARQSLPVPDRARRRFA